MSEMQRYSRILLWITVPVLGFVTLVNYFIDPFGRFDNNRLGIYTASEREQRQATARRWPHDAVFLSNSKLSMQNPAELDDFQWYNMAVSGARVEELTGMMRQYVRDQKAVVLGLDFWMFNESYQPVIKEFRPTSWRSIMERYLVNGTCFIKSVQTVMKWWRGEPPISLPGGYSNRELINRIERENPERDYGAIKDWFSRSMAANFVYSEQRIQLLRAIKVEMAQRNVRLKVFLHPENRELQEFVRTPENAGHYLRFQQEIRGIFPDLIDLTESDYAKYEENFFLKDPIHYTPETSTRFFNEAIIPKLKE